MNVSREDFSDEEQQAWFRGRDPGRAEHTPEPQGFFQEDSGKGQIPRFRRRRK
jgi:hypothetical protein